MVVSVTAGVAVLSAVEPLELGLEGVWAGLALLMTGRLVTLVWRYQQLDGPLPPLLAADADESDNEEWERHSVKLLLSNDWMYRS